MPALNDLRLLILLFSPLLVREVTIDVVTAMVLGSAVGLICELCVRRDVRDVLKGFQIFFKGIGSSFANVVSLLVCADVFARGLEALGTADYLIDSVRDAGFGVNAISVVMTLIVAVTAMITGSGLAVFFILEPGARHRDEVRGRCGHHASSDATRGGNGTRDFPGVRRDRCSQQSGRMLAVRNRQADPDPVRRRDDHNDNGQLSQEWMIGTN